MNSRSRLSAHEVAAEAGCSLRSIKSYAIRGIIPGARQLVDGGAWTFDPIALRRWLKEREEAPKRNTPEAHRRATGFAGRGSWPKRLKSDEAYRRAIGLKQKRDAG